MEIKDWSSTGTRSPLYRELKELDLLENIAELDGFGYTVLPPEKVGPPEHHEAVKNAVLRIAAERKGRSVEELSDRFTGLEDIMRFVLWKTRSSRRW